MIKKKKVFCMILSIAFCLVEILFAEKNVIVLIGNGMGVPVIGVTKYHSEFVELRKNLLNIESVAENANLALLYTYSKSHLVTDSAASATAFGCGIKTHNGMGGVDEFGIEAENIVEIALKAGKSIELISTAELVDATPAGFSAHSPDRATGTRIAKEHLSKKTNVLLGGEKMQYDLSKAAESGYKVITTKDEFEIPDYPNPDDLKKGKGVFWVSKNHTGSPVVLIAAGPGAEKVRGFKDNTFVFQLISDALK